MGNTASANQAGTHELVLHVEVITPPFLHQALVPGEPDASREPCMSTKTTSHGPSSFRTRHLRKLPRPSYGPNLEGPPFPVLQAAGSTPPALEVDPTWSPYES